MLIRRGGTSKTRRKQVVAKGAKYPRTYAERYSETLRRDIERNLVPAGNALRELYEGGASVSRVAEAADLIQADLAKLFAAHATSDSLYLVAGIDEWTKQRFEASIRDAMGIDAASILDGNVFGPIRDAAVSENIALIRSIPGQYLSEVMQAVLADYRGTGFPDGSKSLAGRIQNLGGVSKDRATLIARDQTSKLNASLIQARQEDAGITHYIWRTTGDERVVGTPGGRFPKGNRRHMNHFERDGRVYEWARPPIDGHPGQPICCRCIASPIINPDRIRAQLL